jgi:plastocyanin
MTTTHPPTVPPDVPATPAQPESVDQHRPAAVAPAPRDARTISLQTLALVGVFLAAFAVIAAIFAVGLAARALDEHDAMAARGGGVAASAAPTLVLTEFALTPDTLTVPAGSTELIVRNDGTVAHNVSIEGTTTATIGGGDSTTFNLADLSPGQYKMICAVPGHESAGMTGTITIA